MSRIGFIARNPKTALAGVATLMVAAGLTVGSGAFVADQQASENNAVEAGTANIQVFGSKNPVLDGNNCRSTSDAFDDGSVVGDAAAKCNDAALGGASEQMKATFEITNMVPGQPAIVRCFSVKNAGDVPVALRLDVDSFSGSDDLADVLKLRIARAAFSGGVNGTSAPQGTRIIDNYLTDALDLAPRIADLKTMTADSAVSNPIPAGERRALEPTESYKYCVTATLNNTGVAQPEIEGDTVGFDINVLAQSIYGTALDPERPARD